MIFDQLTCSSGGIEPGCMLLASENTFGVCLSRKQRRHSPFMLIFMAGKDSIHTSQTENLREDISF